MRRKPSADVSSSARLILALLALAACSDEAAIPTATPTDEAALDAAPTKSIPEAALLGGGGSRRGRKAGDGPDGDESAQNVEARLTHALLVLKIDDDAAANRVLQQFGAGMPVKDDARARRVVEALVKLARADRAVMRRAAIGLLARVAPGLVSGDPFAPAMLDADAGVRRQAVIGRTRHGVAKQWKQVAGLAGDADVGVRVAVARGLALSGAPEARDVLAKMMGDADDAVVGAAADGLRLNAGETPQAVLDAAKSPRPVVRAAVVGVLADAQTPAALKQLAAMADDEAWNVRREAVWAMSGFAGDAAAESLRLVQAVAFDADRRKRNERFEALQGLVRTELAPDLDKVMAVAESDKDPVLRLVAARTAALRGDVRAPKVLVDLLETKAGTGPDEDEDAAFVRKTAETVLGEVALVTVGSRSAREWRRTLPEVEAKLSQGAPDAPPQRLAQRW